MSAECLGPSEGKLWLDRRVSWRRFYPRVELLAQAGEQVLVAVGRLAVEPKHVEGAAGDPIAGQTQDGAHARLLHGHT